MPDKLHRCVKAVMKEGKTESQAYAICQASLDDSSTNDTQFTTDSISLSSKTFTDEGYLVARASLARAGIQEYLSVELGMPEGFPNPNDLIKVYRPPSEVFKKESMLSFSMKPITDNHPPEMLSIKNVKDYQVGSVGETITQEDDHMFAKVVITDKRIIDKITSGKVELSNGYFSDYVWTPGITPDGKHYDAMQTNIKGNHVAVVDRGRCGGSCRIMDTKDTKTKDCSCGGNNMNVKMKIAGVDCELEPVAAQLVQKHMDEEAVKAKSFSDQIKDLKAELDGLKEMMVGKQEEMVKKEEEAKASTDALSAQLDEAKKSVLSQAQMDAAVAERVAFVAKVKSFDKDVVWQGKSEAEIIASVVAKANPGESFDGKSNDYMKARFDALLLKTGSIDSMDAALAAAAKGGDTLATADSARAAFIERSAKAYLNPTEAV